MRPMDSRIGSGLRLPSSSHSCDVNQMFPSAPVVIPGSCVVPSLTEGRSANSVAIPLGVMRPIAGVVPGLGDEGSAFRADHDGYQRGSSRGRELGKR